MMKRAFLISLFFCVAGNLFAQQKRVLSFDKLKTYVNSFNKADTEMVKNYITNDHAYEWLSKNVPLFECPDSAIQKIYYYRWWTFRKHLKQTPDGFIFTEFITPVSFTGVYNSSSSALGHQVYEGRWLHDPQYINQYINFWLYVDPKQKKPHLHAFSSWIDDAVYNYYLVNLDKHFVEQALPLLNTDYHVWETEKQLPSKLFWQFDVRDAMEESISGGRKVKNIRPTINSYMYGNALALSKMAALTGNDSLKIKYTQKAIDLKKLVQDSLWNDSASFFEVRKPDGHFAGAREELGFIPWYFNLPDDKAAYAKQWDQLTDDKGFKAPWGITTAERRHPLFRTHGTGHGCEWDGAVWPFATTQTLKGLANLLTAYQNRGNMTPGIFYDELHKYALSHIKRGQPYLGEYQDEKTGYWLKGDNPRSSYYNHSGFCDLVINDLVGLKPREDNMLEVFPLIPQNQWKWFALDNVLYHGHTISVVWDKTGTKYHKGKGFIIYADGKEISRSAQLKRILVKLPG
ncbi:MGH1-like glycoside hydrolase domain-containing protein [Mucilaginibacter kameinonensis]|uniref:MGH1-like glycoside hydrolase domain-containing protein n=1 Tax=Mucilaginibacter kameinonensis TaxID=452286 RepID=UPI000EF7E331|nr:glycosyl hydrolase family 65 protein [Mucilaginibacter kameinonensis]